MAINEQTKKSKVLFISVSQSDEISAKPDTSPFTFHEALNPTITCRAVGDVGRPEPRQEVVDHLRRLRLGQAEQRRSCRRRSRSRAAPCSAPPRIRSAAPSSPRTCPRSRRPSPRCWCTVTPGADNIAFLKQAISFGMKKEMKIAQPLHWLPQPRRAAPTSTPTSTAGSTSTGSSRTRSRRPSATSRPSRRSSTCRPATTALRLQRRSWRSRAAASSPSRRTPTAVADALRKNPVYDHYKGKQWWRTCDNKSIQDLWIVKGRDKLKGEWGFSTS